MKHPHFAILASVLLILVRPCQVLGQSDTAKQAQDQTQKPTLTKFDLDFPGGTPQELVTAIQKSMGRTINVIVPTASAGIKLPPLTMKHVDAAQLFKGLSSASPEFVSQVDGPGAYRTSYTFKTDGIPSDDSVWYLTADLLPEDNQVRRIARFFNLSTYLGMGLTVDDITTAIQTGWKMEGVATGGEMSYHKETNLLIVVGNNIQLDTVRDALGALNQQINQTIAGYLEAKKAKAAEVKPDSDGTVTKKLDK